MKDAILKLQHLDKHTVLWNSCDSVGKAEIWRVWGWLIVFSIPEFGGEPQFEKAFPTEQVDEAIILINSWR
jgi:hypothetical protein